MLLGNMASAALYKAQFFGKDTVPLLFILPVALPGIGTAVVSMPCWELFEAQDAAYRRSVLGQGVRVGIEAAVRQGWDAYLGLEGGFVGMRGFGAGRCRAEDGAGPDCRKDFHLRAWHSRGALRGGL